MSKTYRARRSAFTLVELLVVIGIIGVLIAILLPTLAGAKRQANATRCMTQLREIGNALVLYAADNNNWWPVVLHQATANFPTDPKLQSVPNRNDYWYMFLLKYFSKVQYSNTAGQRLGDFINTPLWGCPEIDKTALQASVSSADFDSGYGMGIYAAYNVNSSVWAGRNAGSWSPFIRPASPSAPTDVEGRYYKQQDYLNPATRGIIADSRSWFLEITWFGGSPSAIPAQPLTRVGYIAGGNQFDRYRHGKYPKANGSAYDKVGGKVAYNVLFCDGHVETLRDIERGYKVFRQRWPN